MTTDSYIEPKGYYLFGSNDYTGSGNVSADIRWGMTGLTTDMHLFLVYNNTLLDKFGWGGADYPEGGAGADYPSDSMPGANGSMERKATATSTPTSMSTASLEKYSGNGYDSNNNSEDFITKTTRDPQNSTISEPSAVGSATIYPEAAVATSGKGTWEIRYYAGISNWTNGQLSLYIPPNWTRPQKTDATAAGYVTFESNSSGEITYDLDITGNTVIFTVPSLTASTGYVIIKYGYTNNKTNRGALAVAPAAAVSDAKFCVSADVDGSNLVELTTGSPTLDVVDVDDLVIDPD